MKKHLNILLILLLVCIFAFAMVACNKDDGNTNPDGPVTPSGDDPEPAMFSVTFDSNGGTSLADFNTTVEYGQTILQPVNKTTGKPVVPTRTGYTFDCWKIGTTETEFVFGYTPITANTVITASWKPKDYALPIVLSENEADLEYISFVDDTGEKVTTLEAKYYTYCFFNKPWPTTTKIDEATGNPDEFEYWYYKDKKGDEVRYSPYADEYDENKPFLSLERYLFDEPITLYAKWHSQLENVTVTYDANGGVLTSATGVTVKTRDGVEKPSDPTPTKDDYSFKYWYYRDDLGKEVIFDFLDKSVENDTYTQVTKDMTVYAKWMLSITISNAADLDKIRTAVAKNDEESKEYATAKYTLADNIAVENFAPLFTSATHFAGEFDGAGYTITINDFTIAENMSFFGYNDGKVVNTNFVITLNSSLPDGSTITKSNIGSVASYNKGDIIDVSATVTGNVNLKDITFGGIVANNESGELTNVTSHVSFTSFEGLKVVFGGIVGNNTSGPIKNSTVELTVKYGEEHVLKASSLYVGGVIGQSTSGSISKANVKIFDVNFWSETSAYAGGVAGKTQGVIDQALVNSALIKGTATTAYTGGVVGINGGTVSNCEIEEVNIDVNGTATACAGGIVGDNSNSTGTAKIVYGVLANGNIVVSSENGTAYAGAIAGKTGSGSISYSYSNASVSAYALSTNANIGNVIGKYAQTTNFTNVYFGENTILKLNDETYEMIDGNANFPICKTAKETLATNDEIQNASWAESKLNLNPNKDDNIWTIEQNKLPRLSEFVEKE